MSRPRAHTQLPASHKAAALPHSPPTRQEQTEILQEKRSLFATPHFCVCHHWCFSCIWSLSPALWSEVLLLDLPISVKRKLRERREWLTTLPSPLTWSLDCDHKVTLLPCDSSEQPPLNSQAVELSAATTKQIPKLDFGGTMGEEVSQILLLSRPPCFPLGKERARASQTNLVSLFSKRWKVKETLRCVGDSHSWEEVSHFYPFPRCWSHRTCTWGRAPRQTRFPSNCSHLVSSHLSSPSKKIREAKQSIIRPGRRARKHANPGSDPGLTPREIWSWDRRSYKCHRQKEIWLIISKHTKIMENKISVIQPQLLLHTEQATSGLYDIGKQCDI